MDFKAQLSYTFSENAYLHFQAYSLVFSVYNSANEL